MAGAATRNKGRRGQCEAKNLLSEHDWVVNELNAGEQAADLIAVDPDGRAWMVEVKNSAGILLAHRKQAMKQAGNKRMPWMLLSHIHGTPCWLVQRQGMRPVVWEGRNEASH